MMNNITEYLSLCMCILWFCMWLKQVSDYLIYYEVLDFRNRLMTSNSRTTFIFKKIYGGKNVQPRRINEQLWNFVHLIDNVRNTFKTKVS